MILEVTSIRKSQMIHDGWEIQLSNDNGMCMLIINTTYNNKNEFKIGDKYNNTLQIIQDTQ